MPTNYYLIRTSDEDKEWLWHEAEQGRLRQGWGVTNTELPSGEHTPEKMNDWCERYRQRAQEYWHEEVSQEQAQSRYSILRPMTEIQAGDMIVIPKMPNWGCFCIAKATGTYHFDTGQRKAPEGDDFRHIIPIELVRKGIAVGMK